MREIKFRAWAKINESYLDMDSNYFYLAPDGKFFEITERNGKADFWEVYADIQFFTGFKDCKGVEIYEGDIVEISYKNSSIKQNAKVVFENGCFYADMGDGFAYFIYETNEECEVIGNIYENADLLKSIR